MPEKGKICQQETHFRRAMDFRQFCQKINWLNMILVVFIPVFGAYCAWNYPPQWKTLVLTFVMYAFSGISITAGYHRLYSHKSYDAACQ